MVYLATGVVVVSPTSSLHGVRTEVFRDRLFERGLAHSFESVVAEDRVT